MSQPYRTAFAISAPAPGGRALLDRVAAVSREWVGGRFSGPPLDSETGFWQGDEETLKIEAAAHDSLAMYSFSWAIRTQQQGQWLVELELSTRGDEVSVEIRVQLRRDDPSDIRPAPAREVRVALASELFDAFPCACGGVPLQRAALSIDQARVGSAVEKLLLNPARRLPVVAVSRDRDGAAALDADPLQERLAGIAHVVAYADEDVSRSMTHQIGRPLACYGGAVRVYATQFNRGDPPYRHRYWLSRQARRSSFEQELAAHVALLGHQQNFDSPFDRIADEIRTLKRADPKRAQPRAGGQESEALRETLSALSAAERDRDEWRRKAEHLERSLDFVAQDLASREDVKHSEPKTVAQAVDMAPARMSNLRFLPSASDSAAESRYLDTASVWRALERLNELSHSLAIGEVREPGIVPWLRTRAIDVSTESEDTMRRYPEERRFWDGDRTLEMQLHIKLGGGAGADANLRIHFIWDADERQILVGHVGRHLRTE